MLPVIEKNAPKRLLLVISLVLIQKDIMFSKSSASDAMMHHVALAQNFLHCVPEIVCFYKN